MTETHKDKIRTAIERLPKVELHVHFGGSVDEVVSAEVGEAGSL